MTRPRTADQMRRFWDSRARENAHYFINRTDASDAGKYAFWASGARDLKHLTGELGVEVARSDRVLEIGCGSATSARSDGS